MSTTEQKLKKIEDVILEKANSKADKIIFKARAAKNESLEKAEMDILQSQYKAINKETTEMRKMTTQYVSNFEIKNKKRLLIKRDDFCSRIFENVRIKLRKFIQTQEYAEKFIEKLKNIPQQGLKDVQYYINPNDQILKEAIIANFKDELNIVDSADIKIGGFKAVDKNTGVCIDETLDTKLEEQRNWFFANSKLYVE